MLSHTVYTNLCQLFNYYINIVNFKGRNNPTPSWFFLLNVFFDLKNRMGEIAQNYLLWVAVRYKGS